MKTTMLILAAALAASASAAIDPADWKVAHRNWGGLDAEGLEYSGGVVPENVRFADGKVYITARGNRYAGPVRGVGRGGAILASGRRTGGAITSRRRLGYGSYAVRMKIVPELGCCSAIWTFRYDQTPTGVLNHEIDIELPGRPGVAFEGFAFDRCLCNTWVGEDEKQCTISYTSLTQRLDDGAFHDYRIDWHPDRVEFFVDGVLVQTNRTHVPSLPSEFWIGAWFPRGWTGTPDFDTAEMVVEDFTFTSYKERNS